MGEEGGQGPHLHKQDFGRTIRGKERKKTDRPREGWEDGTLPPHRDFKERCLRRMDGRKRPPLSWLTLGMASLGVSWVGLLRVCNSHGGSASGQASAARGGPFAGRDRHGDPLHTDQCFWRLLLALAAWSPSQHFAAPPWTRQCGDDGLRPGWREEGLCAVASPSAGEGTPRGRCGKTHRWSQGRCR